MIEPAIPYNGVRSLLEQFTKRLSQRYDLDFSVNRETVENILAEELEIVERALTEGEISFYIRGGYEPIWTEEERLQAIEELKMEVFD